MRLVCVECAVAVDAEGVQACPKCNTQQLDRPTVFDCARLGLLPELEQLIQEEENFDINAYEESSKATILHHAAVNSKMRILEYLFQHPVFRTQMKIDALGGEWQTTPLFWAAYHNHIYAVELLLRNGADPKITDAAGYNPFLIAIQRGFPITAAYLVAKGTDIDVRVGDALQKTALMLLCHRQRFHLDSFRMVLSLRASIDAQDTEGNTPLHHATKNDLSMAVRMLLDREADPSIKNKDGLTPLDIALKQLHPQSAVRHLLTEDNQLQWISQVTHINKKTLEDNVYKFSFFVPWVFIPVCCWIVTVNNGFRAIVIRQVMLIVLMLGVIKLLQKGSYNDKRKAAALMFGVNVASIAWLVGSFPMFAWQTCSLDFQIIATVSIVLMAYTLYKTVTTDPGVVSTSYAEKIFNIQTLVESKSPSATKLCLTCLHRRPLRAKHCAEMNACIAKFDHYCPFVNNGVGAQNHHYFLGFLFFAVVSIAMEIVACWRYAATQTDPAQVTWTHGIFYWLWSIVHFHPVLFCVALLDIVQITWIAYLLFFHIYLVTAALTTNEFVKNENLTRAYSRGLVRNLIDFFYLPGCKFVDWRQICNMNDFLAEEKRKSE